MLKLSLFEIDVEEKKKAQEKREGKERRGCSRVVFLIFSLPNTNSSSFSLFLNFLACEKLHRHPPNKNKNKILNLQTKIFTQILKIKINLQQHK
jgi:hypothetical protein